jgi:hypothetical protein
MLARRRPLSTISPNLRSSGKRKPGALASAADELAAGGTFPGVLSPVKDRLV